MPGDFQKMINLSGETLLKAINSLTQIAKIHQDNNDLLLGAIQKFIHLLKKIGADSPDISIQLSDGRLYFQEQKLTLRPANASLFNRTVRFFEDRNIFGFHFQSDLENVPAQKIVQFFRWADQALTHEEPSGWLTEKLLEQDIHWVSVYQTPLSQFKDNATEIDESARKQATVRKLYANVLSTTKDIALKLSANQVTGMRNSVRLVQKMVDIILEDETLFLGVSTIRVYDDYTYAHSLNVSILAMCLGKQIGLNHVMLERLGLCGLFHDLGKVEIPKELLNKGGALSDKEYAILKTHSMHSARLILRLKAKMDRKNKILVPPFEHHMGYDNSGYPEVSTGPKISLFGRILSIVDVYDAITSPRIYRKEALSPDKALDRIRELSGTQLDPILVKVFINMLGKYPTGTLVKLDSGEMGLVIQPARISRTRPIVQLLVRDDRKQYHKGPIIDLSKSHYENGRFHHNITATLHPSTIGIQAAEYIL
jgi:HD-GYP domain-containing protein (c-di-GMP phosphodiesterase class II)